MTAKISAARTQRLLPVMVAGVLLVFGALPARAAVPTMMNYQGYLTDLANTPRVGSFEMDFGIFADSTGGTALWSETHGSVDVVAGNFNVLLGSVNALPPSLFSGDLLWLETAVSDTTMTPRRPLVTVPYSFHATMADTAQVALGGASGPPVGNIVGQVDFTCTGSNAGVLIYIPGRSFVAFTGPSGDFNLSSVPPGTYTLHVEVGNPVNSTELTDVVVTAGGTTNVGVITLGPNVATDPANCGTCGNVCPTVANATTNCTAGTCQNVCNAGFENCDGNGANGCEANLATNLNNCGTCGNVCSFPNAIPACMSGNCTIAACNTGFRNCDGSTANGCERNVTSDVNNCGTCGNVCSFPNAIPGCMSGNCTIVACNSGFRNCDGSSANGCERNVNTDPNNCGNCGVVCPSGICSAGVCAP